MLKLEPFFRLSDKDRFKNVSLEYYVEPNDPKLKEKVEAFVRLVYTEMPRETGWFHQSGVYPDDRVSEYHMFEFWHYERDPGLVIERSKQIAKTLVLSWRLTFNGIRFQKSIGMRADDHVKT